MTYAYKVVGLGLSRLDHEQALEVPGQDGWELVAVSANYAYLRRPLPAVTFFFPAPDPEAPPPEPAPAKKPGKKTALRELSD